MISRRRAEENHKNHSLRQECESPPPTIRSSTTATGVPGEPGVSVTKRASQRLSASPLTTAMTLPASRRLRDLGDRVQARPRHPFQRATVPQWVL